jgi:predicted dehydrogenase
MGEVTTIGLDLAKHVFQVHGVDAEGATVLRKCRPSALVGQNEHWDCAWMLDPAEAGGGGLRNLGPHGLDMFLHLTGEEAQVTGAQLSRRAHERPVEDYASVMLRSASGILGTVEVGNGFPRDGTDGEWKIAGRDAILTMKDGIMKLATAESDEILPGANVTAPAFTALRDALDHWRRGAAPPMAVVTGASRGIGQATARLLARRRGPLSGGKPDIEPTSLNGRV